MQPTYLNTSWLGEGLSLRYLRGEEEKHMGDELVKATHAHLDGLHESHRALEVPPLLLGTITPEVKAKVEDFYRSVADIFETKFKRRHGRTTKRHRRRVSRRFYPRSAEIRKLLFSFGDGKLGQARGLRSQVTVQVVKPTLP